MEYAAVGVIVLLIAFVIYHNKRTKLWSKFARSKDDHEKGDLQYGKKDD